MDLQEIQKSQKDTRNVSVGTTSVEVAKYNPRRYAIIFALLGATAEVILLNDSQGNNIAVLTGIGANPVPFKLSANDYGSLVHGPWFAQSSSATLGLSITEVLL